MLAHCRGEATLKAVPILTFHEAEGHCARQLAAGSPEEQCKTNGTGTVARSRATRSGCGAAGW